MGERIAYLSGQYLGKSRSSLHILYTTVMVLLRCGHDVEHHSIFGRGGYSLVLKNHDGICRKYKGDVRAPSILDVPTYFT